MPQVNPDASDFEKLQQALGEITQKFGSVNDILEAFGLAELPMAQRYGILFGCIVFTLTVSTVMALLVFGGTFKRIEEQARTGQSTVESDYKVRLQRPLLLERLLSAQQRLVKQNYPNEPTRREYTTNLSKMLQSVPPNGVTIDDDKMNEKQTRDAIQSKNNHAAVMEGYKQNFVVAYRKCQDKPGGGTLVGRPEARFEAFARSYAGCSDQTSLRYRRSYARLYEAVCCDTLASDDKFSALYKERPKDIIGKWVRLEALESKRHSKPLFVITSGEPIQMTKRFDPQEVWGFLRDGPFDSEDQLRNSFVFRRHANEAAFAIIENLTDRLVGVVLLSNDKPQNLTIQLDPPIVGPSSFGTKEQLESCFLLMDRLFAFGYRRIQISIDSKDNQGSKLADRLGFTFEGCILKDQIVKESSRDSNVYGMLNSDWDKGARIGLYKKLYGRAMAKADLAYNKKEDELDEQQRVLAQQKEKELDAASKKDKNA